MTALTVRTFEEAEALGVCWVATYSGSMKPTGWDGLHSLACGWCDYDQDTKLAAIEDYNAWMGNERQRKDFFALPRSVRHRLIRDAQGYAA
jgi:hypothetical protein